MNYFKNIICTGGGNAQKHNKSQNAVVLFRNPFEAIYASAHLVLDKATNLDKETGYLFFGQGN